MKKNKKLIIVGAGEFAEIAYEYFTYDSEYEVAAFSVERKFKNKEELLGLPVIEFENIAAVYPPKNYYVFVAVTYVKLNRERTRLFHSCKSAGYTCASYVSSKAFVWHNVKIGENVFIFEHVTVQHYASVGDNVVLWNGTQISHRSVIENNCWLAPGVVVSGFCRIGAYSFVGSNASLRDHIVIAKDTVLGVGTVVVKNVEEQGAVLVGCPAAKTEKTSYVQFGIDKEEQIDSIYKTKR